MRAPTPRFCRSVALACFGYSGLADRAGRKPRFLRLALARVCIIQGLKQPAFDDTLADAIPLYLYLSV